MTDLKLIFFIFDNIKRVLDIPEKKKILQPHTYIFKTAIA